MVNFGAPSFLKTSESDYLSQLLVQRKNIAITKHN
jgi:hypothetical protein